MRRLEIDRETNLSRGLVFCAAGGEPVDLVTGIAGTYGAASKLSATALPGGAHRSTTAGGGDYISWPRAFISGQVTTQFTILVAIDVTTLQDWQTLFACGYGTTWAAPFSHLSLYRYQGDPEMALRFYTGSQQDWGPIFNIGFSTGYATYVVTRNGANAWVYKNGVLVNSTTGLTANPIVWNGAHNTVAIFTRNPAAGGEGYVGKQPVTALWNRALSASEAAQVGKVPTAFLRPRTDPTDFLGILTQAAGGPTATGQSRATVVVTATSAGSRQTSGAVSARVVVTATATGSKQITTGRTTATAAVVSTQAESRQASGVVRATGTVVARTAGAQGAAVGGLVSARLAVVVTAAGSRQTAGATSARVVVVATAAEKRATSGQTVAASSVVARTAGAQGSVVGGTVRAMVAVVSRQAGTRAVTAAAASARFAVVATALEKRNAPGSARAVGVAYATAVRFIAATGGSATLTLTRSGATLTLDTSESTMTTRRSGTTIEVT